MADSIQKDPQGPDWPLGFIAVAVPSTPVSIMSKVDPNNVNSPGQSIPSGGTLPAGALSYTIRAKKIIFQARKPGASNTGTVVNTGNIYIVRVGVGAGTGNRVDQGSIIRTIQPTDPPWEMHVDEDGSESLNPYRYFVDADTAGDGVYPLLII